MPLPLSSLALFRPSTLRDALHMLRDEGPLTPLAGCTDIYVNLQFGSAKQRKYIDVWSIPELRGVSSDRQTLRLGALTTYTDIVQSPIVRKRLPMLVAAAREIGGRQIQNRGTIGGNIANASPAGDSLPVFAAVDAVVVLQSAAAERRVSFNEFYTGYRTSVRTNDELIVAVEIPRIDGKQYWRKVGTRRAQAISKVMCAAVRGPQIRISLGSVAPTVIRLPRTEQILASGGTLQAAQAMVRDEIAPIDDLRSTAEYRKQVSANLIEDFWNRTK
jgi:CO/xanthine dehydrogenase FAD-binding subunit